MGREKSRLFNRGAAMAELVKIKSSNPAHPQGFYWQFADKVKPGDVIYTGEEPKTEQKEAAPEPKKKRGKK